MKIREVISEGLSPDILKQRAEEYWHKAQEASKLGDGETAERLYDLGVLFNKRYKMALAGGLA